MHLTSKSMTAMLMAAAMASTVPVVAHAQSSADRVADLEKRLEANQRLVEALAERVRQLEGRPAPTAAAPAPTPESSPALAAKVSDLEQQVTAIANKPEEDHGLAVHGFADVGLATGSTGQPHGGNVGSLDFYFTPRFGDRVTGLIELNFEVSPEGDVGVDLERLQLGYLVNDGLTMWVGRFHTPYGYWNTAFHHGAQLQTSVRRPQFLDFEDLGGILPAHSVGLWGTGSTKFDLGRVSYDLYAANSASIGLDDPSQPGTGVLNMNQAGRSDGRLMGGGNLSFGFRGGLDGLTIGAHALRGGITDNLASGPDVTRLQMSGLWGTYLENDWEVMAEYYHFANREESSQVTRSSNAWYVQAGRSFGIYTPYARLERSELDQADPYFAQQASGGSYKRSTMGLRVDLNPRTAIKFEALRQEQTDRTLGSFDELRAQFAVRF